MLPRCRDHFGVGTLLKGPSIFLLWTCPRLRDGWINCLHKYTKVYISDGNRSVKKTSFLTDCQQLEPAGSKTPGNALQPIRRQQRGSVPLTSWVGDGEGPDGSDTFNNNSGDVTARFHL